jgi:hypothetical protein
MAVVDAVVKRKIPSQNSEIILFAKPEGKNPLGRYRCRCEDINKMNLQYIG